MAITLLISKEDKKRLGEDESQKIAQIGARFFMLEDLQLELEVSLTSLKDMQEINQEYRGLDEPTDVLSFPTFKNLEEIRNLPPTVPTLLGSILICPEKAILYNETLLQLLVHGFLHILGFDHERDILDWQTQETAFIKRLEEQHITVAGIPYDSL